MSETLPQSTLRLFPHYAEPEQLARSAPVFLIARLMEDGDRCDLRWLTRSFSEAEISLCFTRRGRRQLSRRSRAFWRCVLDAPAGPESRTTDELWSL